MQYFIDRLFDLAASSAITQGVITALALGGSIWIQLAQGLVPEWLISLDLLIAGFFFGSKLGLVQAKSASQKQQIEDLKNASGT